MTCFSIFCSRVRWYQRSKHFTRVSAYWLMTLFTSISCCCWCSAIWSSCSRVGRALSGRAQQPGEASSCCWMCMQSHPPAAWQQSFASGFTESAQLLLQLVQLDARQQSRPACKQQQKFRSGSETASF